MSVNTVTVKVPILFSTRRGRKRVLAIDGTELTAVPAEPQINNALVKAISRAHRWQQMLEGGEYATLRELADAERINPSYVSRVLRLTLLSPALIEAILDGRQTGAVNLPMLMRSLPSRWDEQSPDRNQLASHSLRNSDAGLTPDTQRASRALVQAT